MASRRSSRTEKSFFNWPPRSALPSNKKIARLAEGTKHCTFVSCIPFSPQDQVLELSLCREPADLRNVRIPCPYDRGDKDKPTQGGILLTLWPLLGPWQAAPTFFANAWRHTPRLSSRRLSRDSQGRALRESFLEGPVQH